MTTGMSDVDPTEAPSPVEVYMARSRDDGRAARRHNYLVVVLRPELGPEDCLDYGGYGFLTAAGSLSSYPAGPADILYVIPLRRAIRDGPSLAPYRLLRPEQGWLDVGGMLRATHPPVPPLLFDVSGVAEGDYEAHIGAFVVPVRISHSLGSRKDGRRSRGR